MTKIQELTKGKSIKAKDGREFIILTKKPQTTGTGTANEANFLIVVRRVDGIGRSAVMDLILSQASLDSGAYALSDY